MGSLALFIPLVVSLLLAPAHTFGGKPKFGPNAVPILERTAYLRAAPPRTSGSSVRSTFRNKHRAAARSRASRWQSTFCADCQLAPRNPIITQALVLKTIADPEWASDVADGGSGVTFAEFVSVVKESLAAFRLARLSRRCCPAG